MGAEGGATIEGAGAGVVRAAVALTEGTVAARAPVAVVKATENGAAPVVEGV